ncbi:MAG: hypothetical protein AB7V08_13905 [Elusimicrobiales bacterium]
MNYTDYQTLEAGTAAELTALVTAAIAQGKAPIGPPRIANAENGQRRLVQTVATPEEGGGGDPGGGGTLTLLALHAITRGELYEAYPLSESTGIGDSLGQYDPLTAAEIPADNDFNYASIPGYLAVGIINAAGGSVAFFPAPPAPFVKVAPGNIQVAAASSAPIVAGTDSGLVFALCLTTASDNGDYTLGAVQMTAGVPALVGTPLTGTFGHDTGFSEGAPPFSRQNNGIVLDGHFCCSIPNSSGGRGSGASLYAFSFNGTTFTLEDTLDLSTTNWVYRALGPDFMVFGDDFGTPNLKFVRYTAAGGFEDAFDFDITTLAEGTDVINWFIADRGNGRIYVATSDAEYTVFRLLVLEPNFTTGTLDTIANLADITEQQMFPEMAVNDVVLLSPANWDPGLQVAKFNGTGFTNIGGVETFADVYDVQLLGIPPAP